LPATGPKARRTRTGKTSPASTRRQHYLLLADTGDNGGQRRDFILHVFEEPTSLRDGTLKPAWSIRARWADGPRDCEAVAVDAAAGKVLLVSKKRKPPELFTLPLADPRGEWREARRIGRLPGVPGSRRGPAAQHLAGQAVPAGHRADLLLIPDR
jgi:hypothetical protein